jgi:heme-degrading monooxygenase HmoA
MNMPSSYYAVIFTTIRTEGDNGYAEMAAKMEELAAQQSGYLGIESVRNEATREGITVSYWKDAESIRQWKTHLEHQLAQKLGKEKWYASYKLRICKVEREYEFNS